ncbi:MAG: acyl-CoA dehydrogenase family protein [Microbacterium sp.]|uniref:acyl-CoA dehydrogenase family protein n=1 Tax=Microbacterium sp. TaxID=51671 RepID=UPI0039E254B1
MPTPSSDTALRQEYVDAAAELREKFATTAAEVDREATFPHENMRLIARSPLHDLSLTRSAGGQASEDMYDDTLTMFHVVKNIAAGDGSTAQVYELTRRKSVTLTGANSKLGAEARQEVIRRVRDEGALICSPVAERGARGDYRVPIRKVDGGVVINGTKYFATGSAGASYASTIGLMEGFESVKTGGGHEVLIDLSWDGVQLNHDWDNMGQRATSSGSITFNDVFVPDGYHWAGSNAAASAAPNPVDLAGIFSQYFTSAVLLGIGLGAMDALRDYLQTNPTYPGIFEDTSIKYQLGLHQARLTAAEAALEIAMQKGLAFRRDPQADQRGAVSIAGIQAKISAYEATTGFAAELPKFLGGQASSRKYAYDRFWRDARTFALTDVMEVKVQQAGAWAMRREAPPITFAS